MRNRCGILSAVVFVLGLLSVTIYSTSPAAEAKGFLGRWDITLANTGDTFFSSWLEVTESDGKLNGKLLWKWGSVTDVKSVEVVDGELRVTRREYYEDKPVDVVYKARLVDGKMLGSVKKADGSIRRFAGVRSIEKVDVSGTWSFTSSVPSGILTGDTLVLNQQNGEVAGKYITAENREYHIQRGKLDGTKLSFVMPTIPTTGPASGILWFGEVHGDRSTGTIGAEAKAPGDKKRSGPVVFTAQRQRKWGEPIQLFNGKDLVGWRPRDPNRGFNWSVKDGVLLNRPPDQDIISEKKFEDFKLHVEFSMGKRSNSGIYLRGRYEMQLLDDFGRDPGKHSNCAIYSRLAPSVNASKPTGEWQTLEATLVGRWLTVVLNGQTVLDNVHLDGITGGALDPNESEGGPLTFQGDHGLVRFRKIDVRPALD